MLSRAALLSFLLLACRPERLVQVPPCEPTPEICDGSDNDCDGQVDENIWQDCANECGTGRQICVRGTWGACSVRTPVPETCNGIDDDCDGEVDEGIPTQACYPGNPKDLENGICRYGTLRCVLGHPQCLNYQLPVPETCNGLDDNCDGRIDENSGGSGLDIVFAIDYSGSMAPVITDLLNSTALWVDKYADGGTDVRMALAGIPSPDTNRDGIVTVMKDLSPPDQFVVELRRWTSASGGGSEPSLDVIYQLANPMNPLQISWRTSANRAVVVYTDEMPQSYLSPFVTQQMAMNAVVQNGLRVFVFTSDRDWSPWSPRPLGLPTMLLGAELDKVIQEAACQR